MDSICVSIKKSFGIFIGKFRFVINTLIQRFKIQSLPVLKSDPEASSIFLNLKNSSFSYKEYKVLNKTSSPDLAIESFIRFDIVNDMIKIRIIF